MSVTRGLLIDGGKGPKPKPENPVRLEDLGSGCSHKNPTPFKEVVLKESVTRSPRKAGYFWGYHRRALGGSRLVFLNVDGVIQKSVSIQGTLHPTEQ